MMRQYIEPNIKHYMTQANMTVDGILAPWRTTAKELATL